MKISLKNFIKFTSKAFIVLSLSFSGCGRVYFPIKLETKSRNERQQGQENYAVNLVPITSSTITKANKFEYKRKIIEAGDLTKPAEILDTRDKFKDVIPLNNDPGPYVLGGGDTISFSQVFYEQNTNKRELVNRTLAVSDDGFISIVGLGKIKVNGFTQSQLEDIIYQKLLQNGKSAEFELRISGFNSKRIFISGDDIPSTTVPYVNTPIYLEDILASTKAPIIGNSKVILTRGALEYIFYLDNSKRKNFNIRMFPNDKLVLNRVNYRRERVFIVGETGRQGFFNIHPEIRETLSDALFGGNFLDKVVSDFSQIYVLRKNEKDYDAYHLDISNPTRVSLASKFEMRPDDIVFVATQPLSLYSRTLSQILGSTGLTLQARDTIRTEIGN